MIHFLLYNAPVSFLTYPACERNRERDPTDRSRFEFRMRGFRRSRQSPISPRRLPYLSPSSHHPIPGLSLSSSRSMLVLPSSRSLLSFSSPLSFTRRSRASASALLNMPSIRSNHAQADRAGRPKVLLMDTIQLAKSVETRLGEKYELLVSTNPRSINFIATPQRTERLLN